MKREQPLKIDNFIDIMNILILTTHLNPGGISRYVINLAKGLQRKRQRVWVATSGGEWVRQLADIGVFCKLIPIDTKSIISPKIGLSFLSLAPLLSAEPFDVIHANTRVTQCLAHFIYRTRGIPYVSAFHGFYGGVGRRLFKFAGQRSIAVSGSVKDHLVKDFGFSADKVRIVYNGLDAAEFPARNPAARKELGFKSNDFVVGMLGRISEEKGHLLAAEAFAALGPRFTNTKLLVSGEGKVKDKLLKFIVDADLSERIKLVNVEANKFFDCVDMMLMPSSKEGFGYTIVEAFLKKIPVIGFDVGGISEVIKNGQNGLLFRDYDSLALKNVMERMIDDRIMREKLVQQAFIDAGQYTLERMAEQTLDVYKQAVEASVTGG